MGVNQEHVERIRSIVARVLEIDPDEITETSRFIEDHQADSLRAIEILAGLEEELNVLIPQEDLAKMTNLKGVCEVVKVRAHWDEWK